jgi:hypothetical protein
VSDVCSLRAWANSAAVWAVSGHLGERSVGARQLEDRGRTVCNGDAVMLAGGIAAP